MPSLRTYIECIFINLRALDIFQVDSVAEPQLYPSPAKFYRYFIGKFLYVRTTITFLLIRVHKIFIRFSYSICPPLGLSVSIVTSPRSQLSFAVLAYRYPRKVLCLHGAV